MRRRDALTLERPWEGDFWENLFLKEAIKT
jgi:hypothetical protein